MRYVNLRNSAGLLKEVISIFLLLASLNSLAIITSTNSGNWNTSSIWSSNTVPNLTHWSGNQDVVVEHDITSGSLTITNNNSIRIVSGVTLTINGNLSMGNQSTLIIDSGGTLDITGSLIANYSPSTITINGTLNVDGNYAVSTSSVNHYFNGNINITGYLSVIGNTKVIVNGGDVQIGGQLKLANNGIMKGCSGTVSYGSHNIGACGYSYLECCNNVKRGTGCGNIPPPANSFDFANCGEAVSCSTVAGTVTYSETVCENSNAGDLILNGNNGNIIRWEKSTDDWATTTFISNTSTTQSYLNLSTSTKYRAVVQDGSCNEENSNEVSITVNPISLGGILTGSDIVPSGRNSGTITLNGHVGDVTGWESSQDDWTTTINITNSTNTQDYTNIASDTKYRAVVTSEGCFSENSSDAFIDVYQPSSSTTLSDGFIINSELNPEIVVCGANEEFYFSIQNNSGSTIINPEISIDFPIGIEYVGASLVESSSMNLTESNISDLNNITLSFDSFEDGHSLVFTAQLKADLSAITHQNSGGVFRNNLTLNHASGSASHTTSSYNILYAALSITEVNSLIDSVYPGEYFTRTVTIKNGGYGKLTEFSLFDIASSESLKITGVDNGVLLDSIITFSSVDFLSVGNNDEFFDQDEVLVVEETLKMEGCQNITSELTAKWGCDNIQTSSNQKFPSTISLTGLSLNILSTNSESSFSGENIIRTFSITNNSFNPISEFKILNEYDTSVLTLDSLNHGTLIGLDTILINQTTIEAFGNGDALLDKGETIVIVEYLKVVGCQNTSTSMQLVWDCSNQVTTGDIQTISTEVLLFLPDIERTVSSSFGTCVDGAADEQSILFVNKGNGVSFNTVLNIEMPMTNSFTAIDEASFEIKSSIQSSYTSLSSLSSTSAYTSGEWDCLNTLVSNPKFSVTVLLPEIQPGDSVWVRWNQFTCSSDKCQKIKLTGWQYDLSYQDGCNGQTYQFNNKEGLPALENTSNFTAFSEGPASLNHDEEGEFSFTLTSASFTPGITNSNSAYEVEFFIPKGLKLGGTVSDITFKNGLSTIQPASIVIDQVNEKVIARFGSPLGINWDRASININLILDSSLAEVSTNIEKQVGMELFYSLDTNCITPYRMPLSCITYAPITVLHCSDNTDCEGLWMQNLTSERISFGSPDNNSDGLPDASGVLNQNLINKRRVMVGDSITTKISGLVKSNIGSSWNYGYASIEVPNGTHFEVINAELRYYNSNSATTFTIDNIPYVSTRINDSLKTIFDYSLSSLVANGEIALNGLSYSNNDSIIIYIHHKVISNPGATLLQTLISGKVYLGSNANPTVENQMGCDTRKSYITLVGYGFTSGSKTNRTVTSCTQNIHQYFYFQIGDNNHAGGDLFPYEYRNWAHIKDVTVNLPAGYEITSVSIYQQRTKYLNSYKRETVNNINFTQTNLNNSSNSAVLNLREAYVDSIGNVNFSDDGFNGRVLIYLKPNCAIVPIDTYQNIDWDFTLNKEARIGGATNIEHQYSTSDRMRYRRGALTITASQQTITGNGPTVTWEINVKNTGSASVTNGFVVPYTLDGTLLMDSLWDPSTQSFIIPQNGVFQLGSFSTNQSKTYNISSIYNSCHRDTLVLKTGYDCYGYPNDPELYGCDWNYYKLFVVPNPSELQSRIRGYDNASCSPEVNLEVEFSSVKLGHVKDLFVKVSSSSVGGISIVLDSSKIKFPETIDFSSISNPVFANNKYSFSHSNMELPATIPGVLSPDSNTVFLRFKADLDNSFKLGDYIRTEIGGKRVCGDTLPTVSLYYDPYSSYDQVNSAGLDDLANTWGMAWGDYDNDGFIDLFVANYEKNEPNFLYHNEGNGTFSKVTTGSIVTDLGSSLGGTWGDYDNDGDLDLFVSNNIGSPNFLYENQGNGAFVKINSGDVIEANTYAHGASWVDYNNDGYLDLYVTDYFPTHQNSLYENDGSGGFTSVTNSILTKNASHSITAIWADYDNDGYLDVFVANSHGENNNLYRNIGHGDFEEVVTGDIVNDGMNSVGASWGDYNNDGWIDLFVTNSSKNQTNMLYENNGNGTFTTITQGAIVTDLGSSHGSAWSDINNDGWLDLIVTNDNSEANFIYVNNQDNSFTSITNNITLSGGESFGVATADYDNDGDYDIFIANHKVMSSGTYTKNFLFQNSKGSCSNSMCFTLQGSTTNKNGIGARVEVSAWINGKYVTQSRQISAQSGGLGAQGGFKQLIGLADATQIELVKVYWPSGVIQTVQSPVINNCMLITEELPAKITVISYLDENENCIKDSNEITLPGKEVKITHPENSRSVFMSSAGSFMTYVDVGTYVISGVNNNSWASNCLDTVIIDNIGDSAISYIPFISNCLAPDLDIELSTTVVRPGFDMDYNFTITNNGSRNATNVNLQVELPEEFTAISSTTAWTSYSNHSLTWDIDSIKTGQTMSFDLNLNASIQSGIGEEVLVQAYISSGETDCDLNDNTNLYTQTIKGSIDPNEKHAFPIGESNEHFIQKTQRLRYRILFQNKGTYMATIVRITDSLSKKLNWNSISNFHSSHNCKRSITKDGVMTFEFIGIELPTEIDSGDASNGYVEFTILPKESVEQMDRINNSADIYFDYNLPIRTNTVFHTISDEYFKFQDNVEVVLFPNPSDGKFTARLSPLQPIMECVLTNVFGQIVYTYSRLNTFSSIPLTLNLPAGIYTVSIKNSRKYIYTKTIIIR